MRGLCDCLFRKNRNIISKIILDGNSKKIGGFSYQLLYEEKEMRLNRKMVIFLNEKTPLIH